LIAFLSGNHPDTTSSSLVRCDNTEMDNTGP